MRWRRTIAVPLGIVCGLFAVSACGLIGGCGAPTYTRGPDGGGSGGRSGNGTGGGDTGTGGAPEGGSGGGPGATGGASAGTGGSAGTTGSGGAVASGGRGGTGGGATGSGGTGPGTGGGMGGNITASGGATAATGGSGSGGAATGGSGSAGRGTGGANTGGANTGGANSGGANTGGANTGGANTGGANTGGANTGGANTGGAGGMGTGGAEAPTGAILYYPFDETTGTTATDQSGNSRNGTVSGGGTFAAGMVRNGLTFQGGTSTTNTYVTIPVGLLTSTRDMTIGVWVKVTTDKVWQRIFDFGKTTTTGYMFLTSHAATGNVTRFAITMAGTSGEQQLDAPLLPVGTWTHVALVFGSAGVSFFVNGVKVATNTALTLRPADLGVFTNQWLGRSTFSSDPYFAGQLDELRIYGRALSDAEVGVLYNLR